MKKDVYIIIAAIAFGLIAYWVSTGGLNIFNKKNSDGPPLVVLDGKNEYDPKTHLFYTPDGKFTVKLPAPPMEYSTIPQIAGWTITTQTPKASYRVAMTHAKIGMTASMLASYQWQTHTQRACQAIGAQLQGTETKGYPFGLRGGTYPGYCSEGTRPGECNEPWLYKTQYFVYLTADDRYEYVVIASGTPEGMKSPETKEFFDSFTIVP